MVVPWSKCGGRVKDQSTKKGKRDGLPVERLMVKQYITVEGTVEQRWWNSGTSDGGTMKDMMLEQWNRDGGTVEHLMVEQRNRVGETVEHVVEHQNTSWWDSRTPNGGRVEHLMLEQWNI